MMDLIHTENTSEFPIRGRELHALMEVETPYHKWFPRMCEYGFEAGKDFEEVTDKIVQNPLGGRPAIDHSLTLSMAKELCMLQRTGKGREVRRHLIRIEEHWNQPDAMIARGLQLANRKMERLTDNLLHPEATNIGLTARIETDAPRARFAEGVEGSDSSRLTLAKLLT